MEKQTKKWLTPALLGSFIVGIFLFFWLQLNKPVPVKEIQPTPDIVLPEPLPASQEPVHPVPEPVTEVAQEEPLPTLENSDAAISAAIIGLLGNSEISKHLAAESIITRIVTTVDNLVRPRTAERLRPISGLPGQFAVSAAGETVEGITEYVLDPANYQRYQWLTERVARLDASAVVAVYQRYYPLFQQAYVDLGYPDGYFNDRLIVVIDDLLATPNVMDPVVLVRPHVLYQFADPALESLSAGQKALLRMGRENAEIVKGKLRELRDRLATLNQ
jgi:hypothetical protein